jgi:penicillin-binding protein 2
MIKLYYGLAVLLFVSLVTGCGRSIVTVESTSRPPTSPTLPLPEVNSTQVPDPQLTALVYIQAWESENYSKMYSMLTSISQDAISEMQFTTFYRDVAAEAALKNVEAHILSSLRRVRTAQVSYRVIMHSVLVGDIERDATMNLSYENDQWRVQWDAALILPELSNGNSLRMEYLVPSRGNIYDRNGHAIVAQSDATALGLIPDQINPDQENSLLDELWGLLGIRPDAIHEMYANFPEGADWYLPLGEVSADAIKQDENRLSEFSGLVMHPFRSRYYFEGGIAPHVVGYVSAIPPEQLEAYKRLGYRQDERVGQAGLEKWGESYLAGKRGGILYAVNPDGIVITQLAETTPEPAQSIYTTLDKDLQLQSQQALVGFKGAIVALERDTGRVLAMASSPGFDPNLFEPTNLNSDYLLQDLFDPNSTPLLNRATQGQYPLGSIFKIITMASALESHLYTADTVYNCGQTFTEIPGVTLYDWTYEMGIGASGPLTLPEGLMRSCNPYFYHIGLDLYNQGLTNVVSDMARNFGLGKETGIGQVAEEDGQVPEPTSQIDATNLATGQGDLLVTPLQVADFIAAVGNGGRLYRPQVIESIAPPDGNPTFTFKPEVHGTLPISKETLKVIQDALVSVVENPRGTAYHTFLNFPIPIAGKTGTAQDPPRNPHAWFAGYTLAEKPDQPDIALVVIVENIGEGSQYAAPIFKRVLESYFFGQPRTPYPWETQIGITRTPTPEATETASP